MLNFKLHEMYVSRLLWDQNSFQRHALRKFENCCISSAAENSCIQTGCNSNMYLYFCIFVFVFVLFCTTHRESLRISSAAGNCCIETGCNSNMYSECFGINLLQRGVCIEDVLNFKLKKNTNPSLA